MEGENLTEANLRETTFGLKNLEFRKIVASNNRDAVFFFLSFFFAEKNKRESNPCCNNGTCTVRVDGFDCLCPPGVSEERCETG